MGKISKRKQKRYILPYIFLFFSIVTLIIAIYVKKNLDGNTTKFDEIGTAALAAQQSVPMTRNIPDINELPEKTPEEFIEKEIEIEDLSEKIDLPFDLFASSVYLYDLNSDKAIYTKNPEAKVAPASLTKLMTALLALEMVDDLDAKTMIFTEEMSEELYEYGLDISEIATFNFKVGEEISMRSALYILMMRSANDAANLIAYDLGGGSMETFVEMMNNKAKEIGANNTHFTNPHGLDNDELYTTAYDMFLITQHAMKNPELLEIASSVFYSLPASNLREAMMIETVIAINHPENPFYYDPNVIGIKTGFTDAAGKCLISTYQNEGKKYLLVLMNSPTGNGNPYGQFYAETSTIFDWAYTK